MHQDATPFLPLPLKQTQGNYFPDPCPPETKTSLRAARPRLRSSAGPLQTALASSAPTCFALEHATQGLAAQGATKTPRAVRTTHGKEHVAARPLARMEHNFFTFLGWALTLARRAVAVPSRSCATRCCWRRRIIAPQPLPAALAITMCLLLTLAAALVAGPILLLGPPAPPAACLLTAAKRTIAALRMSWLKPLPTAFQQTTTPARPVRPREKARQWHGVHGSVYSRGSSLGEELITPLRGDLRGKRPCDRSRNYTTAAAQPETSHPNLPRAFHRLTIVKSDQRSSGRPK